MLDYAARYKFTYVCIHFLVRKYFKLIQCNAFRFQASVSVVGSTPLLIEKEVERAE